MMENQKQRKISGGRRQIFTALLLPMVLISFVAFVLPVARLIQMSFEESDVSGMLTGNYTSGNYPAFFTDGFNLDLITNSLVMSIVVTVTTLVFSFPVALYLFRISPAWRNILFVITISPLLVSSVVRTYGWMIILGQSGLINNALIYSGVIVEPLRMVNNFLGVIIGLVEIMMPYMILSLIAGFGRLSAVYEEAAASLGASAFTRFWRIILPLALPGIALGCLLCFVLSVSSFITPKLLGGGRVYVLATEIYDQAIIQLQWPKAATISVVVLIIFAIALFAYSWALRALDRRFS
ncbi:ABC transporter permease [Arvimicrobium flavum]|uniref:ABC transporter permease n=1 Tax=Arvimicrobium flavum TaxID=3393320 RepID=UPI00237A0EC2|nr:ABC transporter permease [Mesorhizobium shangrilense]